MPSAWQYFRTAETSSVVEGRTTSSGQRVGFVDAALFLGNDDAVGHRDNALERRGNRGALGDDGLVGRRHQHRPPPAALVRGGAALSPGGL
jgi:hypothetical protein